MSTTQPHARSRADRDADRIVVLENGRILEIGDHQTLLDQGGLYYRLYSLGFQQPASTNGDFASAQESAKAGST